MDSHILRVDDVLTTPMCRRFCEFLDEYEDRAEQTSYGVGESTLSRRITLVENPKHLDEQYQLTSRAILRDAVEALTGLVWRTIVPAVYPIACPVFAPIQLRKMLGPTRNHSDNISPFLLRQGADTKVAYRVVTLILTLSPTNDTLVFPRQQHSVQLRQGSAVLFPPYWMFEHSTIADGMPRYALTTWLNECVPVQEGEWISVRPPSV